LGIGPNPQSPIPNPQSPIPNYKKLVIISMFLFLNCIYINYKELFYLYLIMVEEEVDPNQEQYKKLHFRMYEGKYPKENDLVFVSKNIL